MTSALLATSMVRMSTNTQMREAPIAQRPSPGDGAARRHLIRCLPQDAVRTAHALRSARVERECPGSAKHRRLDFVIPKPWGEEYRVYDDALLDAWLLTLTAGQCTSEHSHARKDTELLCLRGQGEVAGGDGRSRPIAPGCIVHIDAGAIHRTTAITALTIVEIETPRDKLDVVRLRDDSGRAGRGYEQGWRDDPRLAALAALDDGPPRARLRPCCIDGRLHFGVESGADLAARSSGLMFAIGLDAQSILRRRLWIVGPRDRRAPAADRLHLTIRTNDKEHSS